MAVPVVAGAAAVALVAIAASFVRPLRRVEVRGRSMEPALEDGDRLVVVPPWALPPWRLRPGQVVVLVEPGSGGMLAVKRIAGVDRGSVTVLGDNLAASTDSRSYGPVPRGDVLGRAWWRYHPPHRVGRAWVRRAR